MNTVTHQATQLHQSDFHQIPANTKSLEEYREDWIRYMSRSDIDSKSLPLVDQYRLALTAEMYQKELHGRHLFHLTLTYKPYDDRSYKEKDVNVFFKTFYTKYFLPQLLGTRNIHTISKKKIQPICLVFLDEHETNPIHQERISNSAEIITTSVFGDRLHHHAILAVHGQTLNRLQDMIGTNTFQPTRFTSKIMTSDIKPCEPMRLLYASKMMWKYPDFMTFPDKFYREHHKYSYP